MKAHILLSMVVYFTIPLLVYGQTNPGQTLQSYDVFFLSNIQKLNLSEEEKTKLISTNDPNFINQEAEDLETKANELRKQAKLILQEAAKLDNQAVVTKIVASEVSGKLCFQKLIAFQQSADSIIKKSKLDQSKLSEIRSLINEASREIKLAREMREEAYAWEQVTARLAALSNVDEKEASALNKFDEVLVMLKKMNRVTPAKSEKRILVEIGSLAQQTNTHLKP